MRQRFGRPAARLITSIACVFWLIGVPAAAQVGGGAGAELGRLQSALKAQRTAAEGLRAEVKRQQRAVGELRKRVETLESGIGNRDARVQDLQRAVETQRGWLVGLGAFLALVLVTAVLRRPSEQRATAALTAARERNQRLRDEMSALDGRIRAAERREAPGVD